MQARFARSGNAAGMLRDQRSLVDDLLKGIWRAYAFPSSASLLAVGGYGRGELFPHSDIDLLILLPGPPDAALTAKLERLVGRLWDVGLEVGHSVRTVLDCIEQGTHDVTVQTTLLEARLIAGSRLLYGAFFRATHAAFEPQAFFKAKRFEQEQRHAKHQDSPYNLEPNLKEAPGGLRDLHVILWIARSAGFGKTWTELGARGFVTVQEASELARYQRILQELRVRLHYLAGRREDRLLFEYQDRLAREMGLKATAHHRASELLMQRYYRAAKGITQLNTILLQNLGAAIFPEQQQDAEPINDRFQKVGDLLDARDPRLFEREPGAILESFLVVEQRPDLQGMTATTLRALYRARGLIDRNFRRDPRNRAMFLAILQQPRGVVHELRRMNQYSILGSYLPSFRRIVGQMQHDLFHVYTVDQHILMVVRNLRRFTMVEHAHEYPLCSRLMSGFERPWLLYIAAIFHDIAKGRGRDHSLLGRLEARRFCRDQGLTGEDAKLVEFMVEHHLTLSAVAQKQDLSDPEVIRRFASVVKTERRLVGLYLLTVADIRGTSPKVWNAWKGKLLEDVFQLTRRSLAGGEISYDQDIRAKQEESRRLLRLYALSDDVQEELWKQLDVAYFMRHEPQEIAWQTRLLHYRVFDDRPVVKARLSPIGEGLQVLIYARDQPLLFARICGYFGSIQYNIVDAKIHTTRHGYALDTFQVMGTAREQHYREMITRIEYELTRALHEQGPLPAPISGRVSRRVRHFPIIPEVRILPDEKGQYHVMSIIAGDRPGLLYGIARVLGQYDISLYTAKIVTLGERAEDVFVISGKALANPNTVIQVESDLLAVLQQESLAAPFPESSRKVELGSPGR